MLQDEPVRTSETAGVSVGEGLVRCADNPTTFSFFGTSSRFVWKNPVQAVADSGFKFVPWCSSPMVRFNKPKAVECLWWQ